MFCSGVGGWCLFCLVGLCGVCCVVFVGFFLWEVVNVCSVPPLGWLLIICVICKHIFVYPLLINVTLCNFVDPAKNMKCQYPMITVTLYNNMMSKVLHSGPAECCFSYWGSLYNCSTKQSFRAFKDSVSASWPHRTTKNYMGEIAVSHYHCVSLLSQPLCCHSGCQSPFSLIAMSLFPLWAGFSRPMRWIDAMLLAAGLIA